MFACKSHVNGRGPAPQRTLPHTTRSIGAERVGESARGRSGARARHHTRAASSVQGSTSPRPPSLRSSVLASAGRRSGPSPGRRGAAPQGPSRPAGRSAPTAAPAACASDAPAPPRHSGPETAASRRAGSSRPRRSRRGHCGDPLVRSGDGLRAHVEGRPQHHVRLGEDRETLVRHVLHQAEVEDLGNVRNPAPLAQEDVGRLDVAVDDSHGVRLDERAADLRQHVHHTPRWLCAILRDQGLQGDCPRSAP